MSQNKKGAAKATKEKTVLEGKRFWRSKIFIDGIGEVEGEVKEADFDMFLSKIPNGLDIDLDKWCITEKEQTEKDIRYKERQRLAKA
tara:strand:+ start:85 stop:345 length:261 start_codon:yes stop_codon:yes gene_type:complete